MSVDNCRERLLALEKSVLADALTKIAEHPQKAEQVIHRLLSTPEENLAHVRQTIADFKIRDDYYDWREAPTFALELEGTVESIVESAASPEEVIDLLVDFFETDGNVIESCDDSDGVIGDVFRIDATHAFVAFGRHCDNKAWLADTIFQLYAGDDYGVREGLLEEAKAMFPEATLRTMVDRLWAMAEEAPQGDHQADYRRRKYLGGVKTLARQLGDAPLYEKAMRAAWQGLGGALPLDVAKVHLECGDPDAALRLAESADVGSNYAPEKDDLLYTIYAQQKNRAALEEVAWRIFRRRRSEDTFEKLLHATGKEKRKAVLRQECKTILEETELSYADAVFLVESGCLDEAATYVLKHAGDLDGSRYYHLVPVAEALETGGHPLAATVCYRALTESILARGVSKYYHHGVRYLKRLDALAPAIRDWPDLPDHRQYVKGVVEDHKRKRSFWSQYGGIPKV